MRPSPPDADPARLSYPDQASGPAVGGRSLEPADLQRDDESAEPAAAERAPGWPAPAAGRGQKGGGCGGGRRPAQTPLLPEPAAAADPPVFAESARLVSLGIKWWYRYCIPYILFVLAGILLYFIFTGLNPQQQQVLQQLQHQFRLVRDTFI